MRKLADAGRNAEERSLLESLRDAGLAVINASAREAASFMGRSRKWQHEYDNLPRR